MRNNKVALKTNPAKLLANVTEVNKDSVTSRQKLKGHFLIQNKLQTGSYIKDLEGTIAINKQIISNLVASSKEEESLKAATESLNQENLKLLEKLKLATRERDDLQAKLLIAEQIIEDYRGAEMNVEDRMKERIQEMLDQLSKKEYVVQSYEKRFHRLIPVLRKYIGVDPDLQQLVQALSIPIAATHTITNIVEANEILATEVQTARRKMAELESRLTEAAQSKECEVKENKEPGMKSLSKLAMHQNSNSTIDDSQKVSIENKVLKQQNNEIGEENELLKNALSSLQKKNEMLGEELTGARRELERLRARVFELELNEKRRSEVFAMARDAVEEDIMKLDDESFEVSAVKGDDIIELINNQ